MKCICIKAPKPRNLEQPICEQYAELISGPDLAAVSSRAMQLMNERQTFGLNDAAQIWLESILTLLVQKGMLRPLEAVQTDLSLDAGPLETNLKPGA